MNRLDRLDLVDVSISCIIGIYAEERTTPQPLVVSLGFDLDVRRAAHDASLANTVDYARVIGEVAFVLQQGAFLLIETAAEVVAASVLAGLDVIDALHVVIKKPNALGGNGIPALTIRRQRDTNAARWTFPFGVVDVVHHAAGLGLYRLKLRSGCAVTLPADVRCFNVDAGRQGEDLGTPRRLDARDIAGVDTTFLLVARPGLPLDAFVRA